MTGRSRSRSVSHIIGTSDDKLGSLRRHAAYLQQIQAAVDATLPANAAGHVRAADCSHGRLLLLADSGTWATRLRYQQRAIIRGLAQRLRIGITHVEVRVRPLPGIAAAQAAPRYLSPAARRLIGDCAGYVEDNPALAHALRRLAASGRE